MSIMEIRVAADSAKVRMWQIAKELGISEFTFSRRMREEFPAEKKQEILDVINNISQGRSDGREME